VDALVANTDDTYPRFYTLQNYILDPSQLLAGWGSGIAIIDKVNGSVAAIFGHSKIRGTSEMCTYAACVQE